METHEKHSSGFLVGLFLQSLYLGNGVFFTSEMVVGGFNFLFSRSVTRTSKECDVS